jgi:hypothetical protein
MWMYSSFMIIPDAIMGFFRKCTTEILPAVPDREGWVTRIIDQSDFVLSNLRHLVAAAHLAIRDVYLILKGGQLTINIHTSSKE